MTGWTFSIYYSSAWHSITPRYDKVKIRKFVEDGYIFARTLIDDKFTFTGADYDTLYALYNAGTVSTDFKVLLDSVEVVTGTLNLIGKWNVKESWCELPFTSGDNYQDVITSKTEDVNIIHAISSNDGDPIELISNDWLPEYCIHFIYPGDSNTYYITRNRFLKDCIQDLFSALDNTILFDANSFSAIYSTPLSAVWDNLMLTAISDLRLTFGTPGSEETSSGATVANMQIQAISDFLREQFNLYWYIDSSNYFKLIYKTDYILSGGIDARNYKSIDWVKDKQTFEQDKDARYSKLQRTNIIAGSKDFMGVDIVYPELKGIVSEHKVDVNMFTDFEDLLMFQDKYPLSSTNSWFLFQTTLVSFDLFGSVAYNQFDLFDETSPYDPRVDANFSATKNGSGVLTISQVNTAAIDYYIYTDASVGVYIIKGEYVNFKFSAQLNGNYARLFVIASTGEGNEILSYPNYTDVVEGANDFDVLLTKTMASLKFGFVVAVAPGTSIVLTPPVGRQYFVNALKHYEIEKTHVITGEADKYNAYLSQAYIDSIVMTNATGQIHPDATVQINGAASITVTPKKTKQITDIPLPVWNPDDIDFTKTITTHLGQLEPKELIINMNGAHAKLTGVL